MQVTCPNGHWITIADSKTGTDVACPCCFVSFVAEWDDPTRRQAVQKPSRSRNDDDDEDDEKPQKKKPTAIKKPDPKKPSPSKKDRDDKASAKKRPSRAEEDDEDDDDADEEEEQELVRLNKRQRNLTVVRNGLTCILVAIFTLDALPGLLILGLLVGLIFGGGNVGDTIFRVLYSLNLLAIKIAFMIGLIMGFWCPAKAETKGTIIGAMVFAILVIVFAFFAMLGLAGVFYRSDADKAQNFTNLFLGLAGLTELIFFLLTMVYLGQVARFFKDQILASAPVPLFFAFILWGVLPQVAATIVPTYLDPQGSFTFLITAALGLISLGCTIWTYVLLYRWAMVVMKIRTLVDRTIADL